MGVLVITFVGLIGLFIPCYFGIRLGASFATILGVDLDGAADPADHPARSSSRRSFHWSNISGFHYASPPTSGTIFFLAWIFVISWNAIAMEAAACYIGECRDPARDAKIALTAEGLYGVFVYIGTAIVFVGVLGASLKTADPLTLYTSFCDHIFGNAGLGQVRHRHPADLRPAALGAQRHHGRGPVAVPGLRGPAPAPVLRAQEQAPRAGPGHGLQRRLRAHREPLRLAGAHLHLLQRRLHRRRGGLAVRVLPPPPVPARAGQPVPHAGLVPLGRPGRARCS